MRRLTPRDHRRDDVDDAEERCRDTEDQAFGIAECRVNDERQRNRYPLDRSEPMHTRRQDRQLRAERQGARGNEDQPVKLHARVAASDERQEEVQTGGEVDEEQREQHWPELYPQTISREALWSARGRAAAF